MQIELKYAGCVVNVFDNRPEFGETWGGVIIFRERKEKNNDTDKTNGEFLGKGRTLAGLLTGSLHVTTEIRQSRNSDRSADFGIGTYEPVIRFPASHPCVEEDPPVRFGVR